VVTYSDVEGGWADTGNVDTDPFFDGTLSFFLSDSSPCIDAGNPDSVYNDIEDPMSPGYALWPSLGGLRNDMGAYGGPDVLPWVLPTGIEEREWVQVDIPRCFGLFQNCPNPFRLNTQIRFSLPNPAHVKIEVYNILGQQVAVPVDELRPAGHHAAKFDGGLLGSGFYFYRMTTDSFSATKKMLLLE
jgi:hypothetical protein